LNLDGERRCRSVCGEGRSYTGREGGGSKRSGRNQPVPNADFAGGEGVPLIGGKAALAALLAGVEVLAEPAVDQPIPPAT